MVDVHAPFMLGGRLLWTPQLLIKGNGFGGY